ncbi:hypothetical protein QFZ71_004443 [Streptomyces sp. V2I9]|nr:hypothetical protein [Streptomyces sp. V2I9]
MSLLLGQTHTVSFDSLVTDPRYVTALLPPLIAEHAAHTYRAGSTLPFPLRGAGGDVVAPARTLLEQVRAGTYRYTAAGAFGEAVERARGSAR